MAAALDLAGKRFGRLYVVRFAGIRLEGPTERPRRLWFCQCECGGSATVTAGNLTSGNSQSCGCWKLDRVSETSTTHGQTGTAEYSCWKGMRARCTNPNSRLYKNYGARGIKVCKRWDKFENFLADMGPMPKPNMTVERKNVNKDYSPTNCVWLEKAKQNWNRRDSVRVEYNGQTRGLRELCAELGLKYTTVANRYLEGFTGEQLFRKLEPGKRYRRTVAERGY